MIYSFLSNEFKLFYRIYIPYIIFNYLAEKSRANATKFNNIYFELKFNRDK
jgi:hypothetical protein